jgi:hypothetical protein
MDKKSLVILSLNRLRIVILNGVKNLLYIIRFRFFAIAQNDIKDLAIESLSICELPRLFLKPTYSQFSF